MPLQAQDATPPTAAPATSTAAAPSAAPSAAAAPASANTAVAALAPTIDATDKANVDDTDGIAATVNDESISDFELRQRVARLAEGPTILLHPPDEAAIESARVIASRFACSLSAVAGSPPLS